MEFKKVHCFFEQSGTFKNAFKKLGYEAFDYDIEDAPEVDVFIDLFYEINKAYEDLPSYFDYVKQDDLVFAFFPCTYFSDQSMLASRGDAYNMRDWEITKKLNNSANMMYERAKYYGILCKLCVLSYIRGFKLIIENSYGMCGFLKQFFPIKNKVVIKDRTTLGDSFKKPTQFFFVNCNPSFNLIQETKNGKPKKVEKSHGLERSIITSEFAENFINYYIL